MNFYYPNFQNDMWRVMGLVFHQDKNHFILPGKKAFDEQKIRDFCTAEGIALGDTAMEVIRLRGNASDKFLEVVTPWNPNDILPRIPHCGKIIITGQKALDTLLTTLPGTPPKTGSCATIYYKERSFTLYRLPSTSRAYPLSLEKKVEIYAKALKP